MRKRILTFLIGLVIGLTLSGIVTCVAAVISASSIKYTDTYNISATNVQDAIDKVSERVKNFNSKNNIVVAYKYNDATCVSGDETTCEVSDCYKTKTANSCSSGTIIKFRVNSKEMKTFYVLHDDGSTMTLQQRENTIEIVSWNTTEKIADGPSLALSELAEATATWENVNTLSYTIGTTTFKNNSYSGCNSYNLCNKNTYTLSKKNVKARIISLQELVDLGCTTAAGSCPIYIYNFTYGCSSYSSCPNEIYTNKNNWGYWTINTSDTGIWLVNRRGYVDQSGATNPNRGVRAVVTISK